MGSQGCPRTGIYGDGWAQKSVRVLLAGGLATTLTVKSQTITPNQRMTVLVDGRRVGSAPMKEGNDLVCVHVTATRNARLIELRFARIATIARTDPRLASTLLKSIGLTRASTAQAGHTGVARGSASRASHKGLARASTAHAGHTGPARAHAGHTTATPRQHAQLTAAAEVPPHSGSGSGPTYINVGTVGSPLGEIRGQLTSR